MAKELSSPCGDKLQYERTAESTESRSYRPLAGISCNALDLFRQMYTACYRPLAGISCNSRTAPKRNSFPAFFKACSAITR